MVDYSDFLARLEPDDERLLSTLIVAEETEGLRYDKNSIPHKIARLSRSLAGRPLIWLYHASLIVHLRREVNVEAAWASFDALWRQHGEWMLEGLDSRWLVSAIDTIADCHPDPATRAAAVAVSSSMTVLRMAETERRARGSDLRPLGRDPRAHRLYDGLRWFAIGSDDTAVNLSARLRRAVSDGTLPARILAALLDRAQRSDTVLRRLADAHDADATRWAARSTPRLTLALFNDTSPRRHYGCTAVVDSIDRLFSDAGVAIGWRHYVTANALEDPVTGPALAGADAIVVNGEGTMHSSCRKARSLAALAPMARAAGKPAWLINATLQDNDDAIVADLGAFTHIWVREGASAAWARDRGLRVTVAPDLSLCQKLEPAGAPPRGSGTIVIDSDVPETNLALRRMARRLGGRLWTMEHNDAGHLLVLFQQRCGSGERGSPKGRRQVGEITFRPEPRGGPRDLGGFAGFLSRHEGMVSGRFHGVCLALLLRLPFHALPSNTWKVEAMIADVGLDAARVLPADAAPPSPRPYSAHELDAIDRYIRRARFEAGEMVSRILSGR